MGEYAPLIQGEIEGFKKGLSSNLILWEHIRSFDYSKHTGEWLVGYGVGFEKSQNIRQQIKNISKEETFENNIKATLFLQNRIYNYGDFHKELKIYLQNISKWNEIRIQKEAIENTKKLLSQEKLQRSLNHIYNYYKENYALVTQMHFYVLLKKLSDLRHSKQNKKITSDSYLALKLEIQNEFEDWLVNTMGKN